MFKKKVSQVRVKILLLKINSFENKNIREINSMNCEE